MYVCQNLDEASQTCLEWVIYQSPSLVEQLAISKDDMVLIGGSLVGVFALFAAFAIVARALNTM